ncbi:hypothetical protein [Rhizobium gallicum]|uniref:hypothetical protein n=1 Tax=Rhizobium gallicum TaxID=56730 RepID=UPI001EF7D36C|nr:hypothetical protein [Rhizobium gallicum]ULJ76722.1 hypothetical protein L2W42_30230 [Rhizobium gallicum]
MRSEPFIQSVRNGVACKHLTAIEIRSKREISGPAAFQFQVEDRNVRVIRSGNQRDGLLVPIDVNGGIFASRERPPDVDQRLP